MTTKPKQEEKYTQGYWVEVQRARIAGGVSAEKLGWEVGVGGLVKNNLLGLTSYVEYGIPYLNGRLQFDFTSNYEWSPYLSVGVPIPVEEFNLEPYLSWQLASGVKKPKLGLKVQYMF